MPATAASRSRCCERWPQDYGFELVKYPVPANQMQNQSSQWLNVRRDRPDYMVMWGWGAMNPTAVKEAAKIRFPMEKFIGIWWSGGEDDARPAGDGAKGYKTLNFNAVGADFPALAGHQDPRGRQGPEQGQLARPGRREPLQSRRHELGADRRGDPHRPAAHRQAGGHRRGRAARPREPRHHRGPAAGARPRRLHAADQDHLRRSFRQPRGLRAAMGRQDLAAGDRLVRADDRRGAADAGAGRGRVRQGEPAAGPSAPSPAAEALAAPVERPPRCSRSTISRWSTTTSSSS